MEKGLHPNPANSERISAVVPVTFEQRRLARAAVDRGIEGVWNKGSGRHLGIRSTGQSSRSS